MLPNLFHFLNRRKTSAPQRPKHCPSVELLESRIAPAMLATVSGGVLKIVGDAGANDVTILGNAMNLSEFTLTSAEPINGVVANFVATGITNITISMGEGDDRVTFTGSAPSVIKGSLKVDGGDGANEFNGDSLTVLKNVTIINGTNATGMDNTNFVDANIVGSLTVNNGDGNTQTGFYRMTAGTSLVKGPFKVTNGSGTDGNYFRDVHFGNSVTIKNGTANPTDNQAGYTAFYNTVNTHYRSLVKSNISVSYIDGIVDSDGIWDGEVFGNVTFDYGSATGKVEFDNEMVAQPTYIHGNLTIKGSGPVEVNVGTYKFSGLIVGKNLTIQTGTQNETLTFFRLTVFGATNLKLGEGNNSVTINDSRFGGVFNLLTGSGQDSLVIEQATATTLATSFEKNVSLKFGTGTDSYTFVGNTDAGQALVIWSKFTIAGAENGSEVASHEFFPFGGAIQIIP